MNYLEKKKKAMLNYVSGGKPTETVQIKTRTNDSVYIKYNGETTIHYLSHIYSTPKIIGCIALCYWSEWKIITLGNGSLNGSQIDIGTLINWQPTDTVDYEIVASNELNNHIIVSTESINGNNASVYIIDSNGITKQAYTSSTPYDHEVKVYYRAVAPTYANGWKIEANQDIKYNGVTYQSGEIATEWNYNDRVTKTVEIL